MIGADFSREMEEDLRSGDIEMANCEGVWGYPIVARDYGI